MSNKKTVGQFTQAIMRTLPADEHRQRWLGWLAGYNTCGAYGRIPGMKHSAKYSYNHLGAPEWLLWLASAAKVHPALVKAARLAAKNAVAKSPGGLCHARAKAVRDCIPWDVLASALWGPLYT